MLHAEPIGLVMIFIRLLGSLGWYEDNNLDMVILTLSITFNVRWLSIKDSGPSVEPEIKRTNQNLK
ncbi:hypothetical protein VCO01S_23410 [Vibrio comitans NBRC 102076]|uniref:Uncharacterized protein n=1 Tax=Vibrio comitans NBRC 102076 TaxID=1219078 RepID=A0A4Y3IQP8_9VIBR|nr:hypothetical protein VCO01S_23410 [Vibrio comitans NBRC 102076]